MTAGGRFGERWGPLWFAALMATPWVASYATLPDLVVAAPGPADPESPIAELFCYRRSSEPELLAWVLFAVVVWCNVAAMACGRTSRQSSPFRADGIAIGVSVGMLAGLLLDAFSDLPAGALLACIVGGVLAFGLAGWPHPRRIVTA